MKKSNTLQKGKWRRKVAMGLIGLLMSVTFVASMGYADGNEQLNITLPVFTGKYDVGVTSLGSLGLRGEATALMKIPEDAEIVAGYVYFSAFSNVTPAQLTDIIITLSNDEGLTVTKNATCIGYSQEATTLNFTYRADASDVLVLGDHRYKVDDIQLPVRPTSGGIYGGGLVAIYSLPNLPESNIWIADGLDYFNAASQPPLTKTVTFPIEGNRFERWGSVKIFAGVYERASASAIWYKMGFGATPDDNIADTQGAVDYINSSNSDPAIDTNPLSDGIGIRHRWSMVEFLVPVRSEEDWASFQLESQMDNPQLPALSGVWNMIAFKLPLEATGCASIGDRIFYDKNSNGLRDMMEAGLPSVKVSLYKDNDNNMYEPDADTFMDSVRTNRLGFYLFQNLNAGTYFVDIDHPYMSETNVALTTSIDPSAPIVLAECEARLDVDFGFIVTDREPLVTVEIDSFKYVFHFGGIMLDWTSQSETENMGYDIYRSDAADGEYKIVNPEVIPVSGNSSAMHHYSFTDADVESGQTYYYKIADVEITGSTASFYGPLTAIASSTSVSDFSKDENLPERHNLGAAYPNPFNGKANIAYFMNHTGNVTIDIYNLMGQKVKSLVSGVQNAGAHTITWDGSNDAGQDLGSGIYLYRMTTDNFKASKRILYLK
ncbi:MAG: SdrD B-like domain-containing protein [Candidatus Zhuqueibacterota bacterium]